MNKKDLNFFYKFVSDKDVNNSKTINLYDFDYSFFFIYLFIITRSLARYVKGKSNYLLNQGTEFVPSFFYISILFILPITLWLNIIGRGLGKGSFYLISRIYLIFLIILVLSIRSLTPSIAINTLVITIIPFIIIWLFSLSYYNKINKRDITTRKEMAKKLQNNYNKKVGLAENVNKKFLNKLIAIHGDNYDFSNVIIQRVNVDSNGNPLVENLNESQVKCYDHDISYTIDHRLIKFEGAGCPTCNNLLALEKDSDDELLESIDSRTKEIVSISKDNTSKLDIIIENTNNIISLTEKIKNSNLDIDTKISKVIETVDLNYNQSDIESYEKVVKEWFNHWEKLEIKSRLFMPTSEFLFDMINKSDFRDYSPFILYYCRTLEFELLNKIFLKFHDYINRKYDDKSVLFDYDKQNLNTRIINSIEKGPLTIFRSNIIYNKENYTLGVMRFLLDLLPTNNDYKIKSKRYELLLSLQELDKFINNEIGSIESKIISDINKLINEYRNPSAHTGVIEKEKAEEFYKEFKLIMNSVMNSFK
tara:strand:+ start:2249 stop:3850 length:1602 start_codon:yes stop_codon:yes gene_type:complete